MTCETNSKKTNTKRTKQTFKIEWIYFTCRFYSSNISWAHNPVAMNVMLTSTINRTHPVIPVLMIPAFKAHSDQFTVLSICRNEQLASLKEISKFPVHCNSAIWLTWIRSASSTKAPNLRFAFGSTSSWITCPPAFTRVNTASLVGTRESTNYWLNQDESVSSQQGKNKMDKDDSNQPENKCMIRTQKIRRQPSNKGVCHLHQ